MLTPADLQRQTLRLYGELVAYSDTLASRLVFTSGQQSSATGLPAAVSIAGGTSLVLDPDAATVKSVFRQGGLDFIVNTLDEALRVLKNELRKHTPLSVALVAEVQPVLDEMTERGVLPDLHLELDEHAAKTLISVQTRRLRSQNGLIEHSAAAANWLKARGWSEIVLTPETTPELRALDVKIMQSLDTADNIRLQWLRRIPHYQRPSAESGRIVWLTSSESALLTKK